MRNGFSFNCIDCYNLNTTITGFTTSTKGHLVAIKHDQDKLRLDLLDPLAIEGLAQVLTFGAKKYADHNWRNGFQYSRLIGALLRHLFAIIRDEDTDPESGLPHIDHLGCCWMFLSAHFKYEYLKKYDDRWKKS